MTEHLEGFFKFCLFVFMRALKAGAGRAETGRSRERAKILHQPEPHKKTPFQKGRAIDVCLDKILFLHFQPSLVV